MAPSFLKDLRRRSKASFRTDRSTDESGASSNETNGSTPSSSTLNSAGGHEGKSTTPPLTNSNSASNLQGLGNVQPPPSRPTISTSSPKRFSTVGSVSGMTGLGSPAQNSSLPSSPYAPRITNVSDGSWVYQKILTVHGVIADPSFQALEGCITVRRDDGGFPATDWPVCESYFKALLYLLPGK